MLACCWRSKTLRKWTTIVLRQLEPHNSLQDSESRPAHIFKLFCSPQKLHPPARAVMRLPASAHPRPLFRVRCHRARLRRPVSLTRASAEQKLLWVETDDKARSTLDDNSIVNVVATFTFAAVQR